MGAKKARIGGDHRKRQRGTGESLARLTDHPGGKENNDDGAGGAEADRDHIEPVSRGAQPGAPKTPFPGGADSDLADRSPPEYCGCDSGVSTELPPPNLAFITVRLRFPPSAKEADTWTYSGRPGPVQSSGGTWPCLFL
jgi:hypothetical protein